MDHSVRKIVIIGPESTGKSSLCKQLADHYNTIWCPEYAREYLEENGNHYQFKDLVDIAKGQIRIEEQSLQAARNQQLPALFIDTDLYVIKVWSEFVFGKCDPFILEKITERTYDLYLLCNTDLPWQPDSLREYPDLKTRHVLFHMYKDILVNQRVPWAEISGNHEYRFTLAVQAVESLLYGSANRSNFGNP